MWCGDALGYTCSYTTADDAAPYQRHVSLYRYTRFRTQHGGAPILQLMNHQKGILSLLNSSIAFNSRRGLSSSYISDALLAQHADTFRNLTCMTLAYSTSNELVVGGKNSLFRVDLNKPQAVLPFAHKGDLSFINYTSKLLTLGLSLGSLEIFDPTANQTVKTFAGHNGLLSDLDVKGYYVATCGYSARTKRYGGPANSVEYMVDPLVNIYDLRTMRALSPIPFSAGASFVKFHPKLPNIIVIASTTGQIQFVDMYDLLEVHLYQADLTNPSSTISMVGAPTSSYLLNLDISENGEYLCFSDGYKNMHLWSLSTSSSQNFANFPAALDRPDVTSEPVSNPVGLDASVPLNAVGMPYYKEFLASNFPTDMVFTKELAKVPAKIELDVSSGIVSYDKNKHGPRYVYSEYEPLKVSAHVKSSKKNKTSWIPKFISERSMTSSPVSSLPNGRSEVHSPGLQSHATFHDFNDNDYETNRIPLDDVARNSDTVFQYKSVAGNKIPPCYTKLDIHYSKFGVDDFDFNYYNRSGGDLAGLENHIDNSYVNPLLQIYRYIPIFYNTVTESLKGEYLPNDYDTIYTKSNPQGSSILNELAYLFDMMHNAGARNVSISNFSSILSESNIAKTHGLINKDDGKSLNAAELQQLIITFNKFLVESVVNDYGNQVGVNIQDLTALHYELDFYSNAGELLDKQFSNQATLDLTTPPPNILNKLNSMPSLSNRYNHSAKKNNSLLTYLDYSLNQLRVIPASNSTPYPVEVKQSLFKLGPVLLINLPFTEQEFGLIKSFKKWLVPEFYTTTNAARKVIFKPVITQYNQQADKYELQGYVCEISHGPALTVGRHNLVSYVKVRSPALGKDQWVLFNDFLVMPISEDEVFNISYAWKKPMILVYHNVEDPRNQRIGYFDKEVFHKLSGLNDSILYRDHFACGIREGHKKEYELLTKQEAPEYGSLIAIDAEFVSLRHEVAEVSFTGLKNLVRPTLLSLARISALRGNPGPKHGVPFIDDYIVHTKPIYDYLTVFSGIEEGDLDPERSNKTLVTLQTAYRRLWLLLNMGCVFVGHGLKSDFRCINLQVPKAQIRDTIEFYYLPNFRRMLSLKFLAYSVLKENVQTRNHDSIEDANTALRLFEKYMELKASGEFELALQRIYADGQQLRFRVPEF